MKTKVFQIRLEEYERELLRTLAIKREKSAGELIRALIRKEGKKK